MQLVRLSIVFSTLLLASAFVYVLFGNENTMDDFKSDAIETSRVRRQIIIRCCGARSCWRGWTARHKKRHNGSSSASSGATNTPPFFVRTTPRSNSSHGNHTWPPMSNSSHSNHTISSSTDTTPLFIRTVSPTLNSTSSRANSTGTANTNATVSRSVTNSTGATNVTAARSLHRFSLQPCSTNSPPLLIPFRKFSTSATRFLKTPTMKKVLSTILAVNNEIPSFTPSSSTLWIHFMSTAATPREITPLMVSFRSQPLMTVEDTNRTGITTPMMVSVTSQPLTSVEDTNRTGITTPKIISFTSQPLTTVTDTNITGITSSGANISSHFSTPVAEVFAFNNNSENTTTTSIPPLPTALEGSSGAGLPTVKFYTPSPNTALSASDYSQSVPPLPTALEGNSGAGLPTVNSFTSSDVISTSKASSSTLVSVSANIATLPALVKTTESSMKFFSFILLTDPTAETANFTSIPATPALLPQNSKDTIISSTISYTLSPVTTNLTTDSSKYTSETITQTSIVNTLPRTETTIDNTSLRGETTIKIDNTLLQVETTINTTSDIAETTGREGTFTTDARDNASTVTSASSPSLTQADAASSVSSAAATSPPAGEPH